MNFLFGHKSGHFRRVRCGKKAKYWAFRAFSSKMLVGRMSGIFRHFLGIFGANHLVTRPDETFYSGQYQGDQKWAFRPMSGFLKGLLAEKNLVGHGPFFGPF